MKRRNIMIWVVLLAIGAVILGACSTSNAGSPGFVHIEEGATETQAAETAIALANPTATPGPSPTPTVTGTPYVIPTNPPDFDGSTVITRVGNQDLTLADYQKHVRFDRYRLLFQIVKVAEKYGPAQILDLSNQDNAYVSSLFATLADSYSLGAQTQRLMVIEAISLQEAIRRGMEIDPFQFDAKMAEYLGLQVAEGGKLPPEYEERYAEFLQGIKTYANMSEEEFRRIVRARTLYTQLEFLISHDPDAIPTDQQARVGVDMQDIVVSSQAEAQVIADRLRAGEPLSDIAASLGYAPSSPDSSRLLRWSDPNLTDEVLSAVFEANPGDVVGPFQITAGWYVGKVGEEVFDALSPKDIDALRKQYFLKWVEDKMDDPAYVTDYNNWIDYTPQEPLPQDVSPLLRDENIILPEGTPTEIAITD